MASKTEMEGGAVGGKNADDDASVMASKTELEGEAVGGMNADDDAASMASHASGSSSGNVKTKLKVMQILEEHKKAELRTKLAALSAKRELQRQRQELQWKEEQLALDTEMAVHQARSDVVEKFEKELDGEPAVFPAVTPRPPVFDVPPPTVSQPPALASSVSLQAGPIPAGPVLVTGVPHHAVHAPDQSSQSLTADQRDQLAADQHDQHPAADQGQQAGITDVLTGLTQLLTEQTRRYLLPALEPRVFKGDIEEFSLWMKSFECYIEARTTSPAERLHFLTQYTGGEARSAIHGLLHLRTEDAYTKAKKLLTDRYGNDFITANTYKRRLREWPAVRNGDGKALRQLADFLEHLLMASEEVVGLRVLDEPSEIGRILKKLPRYVLDRWKRVVDTSIYDPAPGQVGVYPSFSQFTRFLTKEARVACGPVTLQEEPAHVEQRTPARRQVGPDRARAFLAATTDSRKPKCAICDAEHQVDECGTFNRMGLADKTGAVMRHGLCKGCLKTGHIWRSCRKKMKCEKCFRWHPTALHDDSLLAPRRNTAVPTQASHQQETRVKAVTLQVTASDKDVPCSHSMVVPVRLECEGHPEHEVVVYALLDPQSDACFIKESVGNQIQAKGEEVLLELSTMAGKATMKTASMKNLIVKSIDGDADIKLPTAYSRQEIPADRHLIPRAETVRKWPHLEAVSEQLPRYFPDAEVGLLIGMNCPRALKPRDVVLGDDEEPWAVKTELGWSVVGPMRGASTGARACRYTSASEGRGELCHFAFRVHAREVTPMQIARMLEADFQEVRTDKRMSQEDQRFLKLMEEKMCQREDGHFEAPLPLKDPTLKFPNNRQAAEQRLTGLKKRLNREPSFRHDYENFMTDMLKKGYAEPVPENELSLDDGRVWYVAHHGVYHPKKKKLRVVFDCSGEYQGLSLNSQLLQGPDHANSLAGVLARFRKQPVVVGCDIEGMFNQVGVDVEHRNLLRFLWWAKGDLTTEPTEYRMTTHLFGATSSPACAMYALNATADKFEDVYGEAAADFIRKDFYVDDGLTSTPDADTAAQLVKNTANMCKEGGFKLNKFVSNDPEVMKRIPPEDRSKNLQNVEIGKEDHPLFEQALGITWNASDDTLHFSVDLPKKPPTRRGILSMVSSLYDPLGLLSPFTLKGKCILKQLCCDGISWDEVISEETEELWKEWKDDTMRLSEITVPRCYIPQGFGKVKIYELHHFSDASMDGCAQCSYLRVVDEAGRISSHLVMSKTKVTPKHPVTVPRLELTAAVMSMKTSRFLRNELDIEDLSEFYWTDSRVVLGYIHNEARRFHVFVANRIQQIREHTSPTQWRYVKSEENPADLASRGLSVRELKDNKLWWSGPSFLTESLDLLDEEVDLEVDEEDPEVKKPKVSLATCVNVDTQSQTGLLDKLERFSSWHRAKRAIAVCLRYRQRLYRKMKERAALPVGQQDESFGAPLTELPITASELRRAEHAILKSVQTEAFEKELKLLKSTGREKTPGKQSDLHRLDPLVDADGLLRVGGRLRRGSLSTEVTHPVILPKRGHVTDLIVTHFHEKTQHGGRDMTLSEIRTSGFWIVQGRMAVARHILKCVKCKRLRGTLCQQKMADLPAERLQPTEPFCYTGVDYFGPFYVRERRSEVKRWGVLFVCLNSRAIHLETANSLTTDAFLNAYRRFVSRRGPVKRLYCDNGTNFVGGRRELESALKEMDVDKLKREMLKDECDLVEFQMNVPHASHMGGIWERQIRSARAVLTSLLDTHGHQLDDELLRTLMTEAESIVNSRPLSYCSMTNTNTVEPITPNQLLTLKTKVVLPLPGRFCEADLYARQRWRRVQHLASLFWTRWRREVLPNLQERKKWTDRERNLEEGDVVVVTDNSAPRSNWPLGRITAVYPSADDLVRKVQVQVGKDGTRYDRPVHCLVPLLKTGRH